MVDQNEKKIDIISSLQSKIQPQITKEEDYISDENWNDYSDDDDDNQNIKPSAGKVVVQGEVKSKTYNNLKDVLGADDKKHSHNKYKQKKPGNFYPKKDNSGVNKPVFHNSGRIVNEIGNGIEIKNSNKEYAQNKYEYKGGKGQYNSYNSYTYKKNDEREIVMKSINNFGNLVKNITDENSKIKPPLRDYTEVDFNKNNYRKNYDLQKPQFTYSKNKEIKESQSKYEELQRPQFCNKNLENRETNFVDLDNNGDLYLKKLQINEKDDSIKYKKTKSEEDNYKPYKQNTKYENYHSNYEEEYVWNQLTQTEESIPSKTEKKSEKTKKTIIKRDKNADSVTFTLPAGNLKDLLG